MRGSAIVSVGVGVRCVHYERGKLNCGPEDLMTLLTFNTDFMPYHIKLPICHVVFIPALYNAKIIQPIRTCANRKGCKVKKTFFKVRFYVANLFQLSEID